MKTILLSLVLTFFTACSNKYEKLDTVENVDINKYLGTWYEIARNPHSFEKDCKNVKATYSLKKNNKIKVTNTCVNINTNKQTEAIGSAYSTNKSNSKLKVTFFWPFYGNYWILMLDKDYSYAVIGEPLREYLWILSREKHMKKSRKNKILKYLNDNNYSTKNLIWTIQENKK